MITGRLQLWPWQAAVAVAEVHQRLPRGSLALQRALKQSKFFAEGTGAPPAETPATQPAVMDLWVRGISIDATFTAFKYEKTRLSFRLAGPSIAGKPQQRLCLGAT